MSVPASNGPRTITWHVAIRPITQPEKPRGVEAQGWFALHGAALPHV